MNNMELATAIISSPRSAFASLKEQPKFWFPLLAVLLSTVAVLVWYYGVVDIDWLVDRMMSANPRAAEMTDEQRARGAAMMSPAFLMVSSVISVFVFVAIARLLEALYFLIAGNITNVRYSYKHWFSLACWSTLPQVITALSMAAFLLTSGSTQISNEELSVLSLNELFFHVPFGGKGYLFLSSITLIQPWCWWLTALGVRVWSGRSWLFSALFGLLPVIFIYGVWALFAFR